ncbi:hypothetical protein MJ572_01645 [Escherichia coli]|nr:hypothetical protein MJ572_01645 [Escherichia coli]
MAIALAIGGEVEVGIVGDNQRRFAAQLHGDLFQYWMKRPSWPSLFAAGDAAGEGYLAMSGCSVRYWPVSAPSPAGR